MSVLAEKLIAKAQKQSAYQTKRLPPQVVAALADVLEHNAKSHSTKRVMTREFLLGVLEAYGFQCSKNTLRRILLDDYGIQSWDSPDLAQVAKLRPAKTKVRAKPKGSSK